MLEQELKAELYASLTFGRRNMCVCSGSYNNYHMMGCIRRADVASGRVRNCKLSGPYEEMHGSFHLFVFYRKTCAGPSLLMTNICLDSRI